MVEIPTAAQVTVAAATVRGLVGGLDVDAVPLSDVPDLWDAFDRVERLAAGAKVLLARKVDESKVWQRAGYNTAAVWMSRHGGTSVTAAQDILAASKRLTDLRDTPCDG